MEHKLPVGVTPIDPDALTSYNGVDMAIRDVPDVATRAMLGYGHLPFTARHRSVHDGDWPYTVDTCLVASSPVGVWINGGRDLACPGCGLDGT